MNKREWTCPQMTVEEFQANEYVAACYSYSYSLYCEVGSSGKAAPKGDMWLSDEYGLNISHSDYYTKDTCADPAANCIVTDSNGKITSFKENNGQQGTLAAGVDAWVDLNSDGKCNTGDLIYWHTYSADGARRWNHWGYAQAAEIENSNRS